MSGCGRLVLVCKSNLQSFVTSEDGKSRPCDLSSKGARDRRETVKRKRKKKDGSAAAVYREKAEFILHTSRWVGGLFLVVAFAISCGIRLALDHAVERLAVNPHDLSGARLVAADGAQHA